MKGQNSTLISEMKAELTFVIFTLANMYTGARFSEPPTKEEVQILAACSRIVLRDYVCLSLEELDEAFSLAASGKFEGINIETYYGQFTPQILGKILKSYLIYRRKVLGAYNEQKQLVKFNQEKFSSEQKREMQKEALEDILSKYKAAALKFNENLGDFDIENDIKASWARPLVKMKVIIFDMEEKKEILGEAKVYVTGKLKSELHNKKNQFSKLQSIKHTLRKVANNQKDTDYNAKVVARYSKLLILKSIIKE